jgi:glycosyltransferase involved in cell wall biosynthesis
MTNGQRKDPISQKSASRSLRVALIASEHTIREYSMFLQHLLVGLADESMPVALVCPPQFDPASVFTGAAEVISHPAFNLPLMGHINIRLLTERLAKFEPAIIHCLCESKASLTSQLAYRLDLPYVLMVNSLQKWWKRLSVSSQYCARIVVPAKSLAENMMSFHPDVADRIQQINIGTFAARSSGCFSDPSRLVSMVIDGPVKKVDDIEILLNVTRHLMIDGYEFMAVIAGGERAARQMWKLLDALGLLRIVTIMPRQLPLRPVLAAADIFIQPQPNYAFNPVLLEAMSVGAAVAGCTGGVDDLIIEDRTAVVFDPNDEMSIMRTLKRLLDRREFARQIAANAQQYLKENYSVGKMIAATLKMYYEIQE